MLEDAVRAGAADGTHLPEIISAVKRHQVDHIIHLAAIQDIDYANHHPVPVYQLHLTGTINVLETARLLGLRRIIIASTTGVTTGVANFLPELSLRMYEAANNGDLETVVNIQRRLEPLNRLRGRPGNHVPVVKAALDMLGLAGGIVRPPLLSLGEVERRELVEILRELGLSPRE